MDRRSLLKLPLYGAAAALGLSHADGAVVPPIFIYCVVAIGGIFPVWKTENPSANG